ncbi:MULTISPECIES: hypothetical protein [unclassified Blastococcus]
MLLVVWIAVPVLCLLVLAGLAYGAFGALQRLGREAQALEREVAPLMAEVQAVQARAAASRSGEEEQRPPDVNTR